jgi:hypothetical protein
MDILPSVVKSHSTEGFFPTRLATYQRYDFFERFNPEMPSQPAKVSFKGFHGEIHSRHQAVIPDPSSGDHMMIGKDEGFAPPCPFQEKRGSACRIKYSSGGISQGGCHPLPRPDLQKTGIIAARASPDRPLHFRKSSTKQ